MKATEVELKEELVLAIDSSDKSYFIASINICDIEVSAIGNKLYKKGRLSTLSINKVEVTDHSEGKTIAFKNIEAAEEYLMSVGLEVDFTCAVNEAVDEYLYDEI